MNSRRLFPSVIELEQWQREGGRRRGIWKSAIYEAATDSWREQTRRKEWRTILIIAGAACVVNCEKLSLHLLVLSFDVFATFFSPANYKWLPREVLAPERADSIPLCIISGDFLRGKLPDRAKREGAKGNQICAPSVCSSSARTNRFSPHSRTTSSQLGNHAHLNQRLKRTHRQTTRTPRSFYTCMHVLNITFTFQVWYHRAHLWFRWNENRCTGCIDGNWLNWMGIYIWNLNNFVYSESWKRIYVRLEGTEFLRNFSHDFV